MGNCPSIKREERTTWPNTNTIWFCRTLTLRSPLGVGCIGESSCKARAGTLTSKADVSGASSVVSLTLSLYESVATIRILTCRGGNVNPGEYRSGLVAGGRARHLQCGFDEGASGDGNSRGRIRFRKWRKVLCTQRAYVKRGVTGGQLDVVLGGSESARLRKPAEI